MDGHEYEYACAQYLKRNEFTKVQVTKASGDQGIDIIATKGKKYGIQCIINGSNSFADFVKVLLVITTATSHP